MHAISYRTVQTCRSLEQFLSGPRCSRGHKIEKEKRTFLSNFTLKLSDVMTWSSESPLNYRFSPVQDAAGLLARLSELPADVHEQAISFLVVVVVVVVVVLCQCQLPDDLHSAPGALRPRRVLEHLDQPDHVAVVLALASEDAMCLDLLYVRGML